VLDEALEHLVREEQVDAGDQARDQHHHGALDQLLLAWPVDLLELGPRLADEALAPLAGDVAAVGGLRGLGGRRPQLLLLLLLLLLLALRRALKGGAALGLRGTASAALGAGLAGHYLVSLWAVCLPHQRQYFENSTRSGVFRFDFSVW
jgi:hypothetical protein